MSKYIIALGSSHRSGKSYIDNAVVSIRNMRSICFLGQSRIYKNSASMTNYNSMFYNCAIAITSNLHPVLLYREFYALEMSLGRIRTYKNGRRTIDIDVLISLDFTYKSANFYLPHPQALNRIFFVLPAIEVLKLAGWQIPVGAQKARAQFGSCLFEAI